METFGVGRSALEAVAPDNFGGMSIEWTAEGGRWVVRSSSAPALFPNAAPPAKKVPIRRLLYKASVDALGEWQQCLMAAPDLPWPFCSHELPSLVHVRLVQHMLSFVMSFSSLSAFSTT